MSFQLTPVHYLMEGLRAAAMLSGPPLIAATAVGLVVALIQTLLQLQEQTLPVAVKLMTVAGILLSIGFKLSAPLVQVSERVFVDFPTLVR